MNLNKVWKYVLNVIKNKFILTVIVFLVWILFFDNNNIMDRVSDIKEIEQLDRDRAFYIERIANDRQRLKELRTNNDNLEKFAREQYLMKKDNEDVFVIVEKEQ